MATVLIPLAVWFAPLPIAQATRHALAVSLFIIIGWITLVLPHAITGLIGCFLFWVTGVAKINEAFSGFVDQTTWFYLGILLFGLMTSETGLSRRLGLSLFRRAGKSYSSLLLGLILLSFALTFIVPSGAACVVIKAAIVIGLLEAYGYGKGSNVGRAMFITLTYTAGLFDKMVVGGPSAILGRGLIAKGTGIEIYWSQWLLANLPIAIATIFIMWRFLLWLYPPEHEVLAGGSDYFELELGKLGAWSAREKRALILLLVALILWATDFIHHIPAAMVGLGIGLAALLPYVGVLDFDEVRVKLNYMSMFFMGAALSLGAVLTQTKAVTVLTRILFDWMAPLMTNHVTGVLVPYGGALIYHFFSGSELSMLSTSIPPLMQFAQSHHLNPVTLGLLWTVAGSGKLFVYQSTVLIVGYSYGYFDTLDLLRVGAFLCVIEAVLLVAIVPWYWPMLGV